MIDHTTKDFTVECDDALADFLRIADIQRGCLLELVVRMPALFLDDLHDLLATDRDLPADGVLRRNHILAQTVEYGLVGAHVLADERLLAKLAPVALDLLNGPAEHSHLQG